MSGRRHVELFERGDGIRVGPREPRRLTTPEHNPGGQAIVARGQTKTILEIDVERPALVTLGLTRLDQPLAPGDELNQNVDAPLVARVGWGAGRAAEPIVRCDWLNGLSLTVPVSAAGHVRVDCEYPAAAGAINLPMMVGAVASYGPRPAGVGQVSQARLTETFSLLAAGSQLFACPPRATAFRLLTNRPASYGAFSVAALTAINSARATQFAFLPVGPEENPLGAGTRAVLVTNNAALATLFALQWTIAL